MTDPHQKAEQLVTLADVHEQGRKDPNAALDALLQSIGERPEDADGLRWLEELVERMKRMACRPGPVREVRIPKAGKPGATRSLGISNRYSNPRS